MTLAAAVVLGAASACSCGSNMQAVYEGDVRFEHCMALDASVEVRPLVRRACWTEWLAFYTYGQTRDRVEHATRRSRELGGQAPLAAAGPEAPGPANALGPPPLTAPEGEEAAAGPEPPPPEEPGADRQRCTAECRAVRDDCGRECATASCRKRCAAGYRQCARECG
ncbi:MAG: hypothetical protein HY744_09375 [Deltaproteobacteria bacterium]|nr:hypothetical protein [Deltaproteobacteria bacterium]